MLLAEQQFFCEDCALDENKAKVLFVLTDGANDAGTKKVGDVAKSLKVWYEYQLLMLDILVNHKMNLLEIQKRINNPVNRL